jgi:hypothetical protein
MKKMQFNYKEPVKIVVEISFDEVMSRIYKPHPIRSKKRKRKSRNRS